MAAAHAVANDLADARLERLETLRHAQMQIEKAVIHAAHGDAQADAILAGLRLGVAGHGFQARLATLAELGDGCEPAGILRRSIVIRDLRRA